MKDDSISQQNQKLRITKNKCQLERFVNGSNPSIPKEKLQTFITNSQYVNAESLKQWLVFNSHPPLDSALGFHHHPHGQKLP